MNRETSGRLPRQTDALPQLIHRLPLARSSVLRAHPDAAQHQTVGGSKPPSQFAAGAGPCRLGVTAHVFGPAVAATLLRCPLRATTDILLRPCGPGWP